MDMIAIPQTVAVKELEVGMCVFVYDSKAHANVWRRLTGIERQPRWIGLTFEGFANVMHVDNENVCLIVLVNTVVKKP